MVGKRLAELRKREKMTQKELADKFGLTAKAISFYELEQREPSGDLLTQFAKFFNVTTDYLLGASSNPQLSRKNELDIQKNLQEMKENFSNGMLQMQLDGEELDDEIIQYILDNLEDALTIAKIKSKEKFTPKKYRNDKGL
ncbi:helix-turn-helix domain-containing protein [Peptoniphilus sp. MSJ-1]|uniref:Helix-turn-helix domain-containing protein n=1 Tax=Peptoniphilus ovalis TaxID=2841503 RepID=A0ABS6FHD3_9FIRM|nr:helix-turn-helix transcriptional regulator [Peptoniphilus ovalis]MBU5669576.1 helix-turn-helix domain-containing protein [Peptoniphilus ovalis]